MLMEIIEQKILSNLFCYITLKRADTHKMGMDIEIQLVL